MKTSVLLIFLWLLVFVNCRQEETNHESIFIENAKIAMEVDPFGGAITGLMLAEDSINYLSWGLTREEMPANNQAGAPFRGHFLCYGRWGAPTSGELEAGIPHNGAHNNLEWEYSLSENRREVTMEVNASLDLVDISRRIEISDESAVFRVSESFEHRSSTGRLSNIVQHITLGPPFLNDSIKIYSNAAKGFLQINSWPDPDSCEYEWPYAMDCDGNIFDLRYFQRDKNFVSTHIIEDTIGWVVALDPVSGSFLGYLWETDDYSWINFWNQNREGVPWAYGMEFGTTGIGRPYQDLLETNTFFHGYASYFFLDAGERIQKDYYGFAGKLEPGNYRVQDIKIDSFITVLFKSNVISNTYTEAYDIGGIKSD